MSHKRRVWYRSFLTVVLGVELVGFALAVMPLKAQPLRVSVTFPPSSQRGAPSRTAGGGQRNPGCVNPNNTPLTALTPSNNVVKTVSANPTLFLYVPQTTAKTAEFVVVDDKGNEIYLLESMTLPGTPGVMKLSLPNSVSLQAGKTYTWQFALICNPAQRQEQEYVRGWLELAQLNGQQQALLKAAEKEPLKQVEVYAAAEIWQEALAILVQLRQRNPNDSKVTEEWQELLKSVDLEAMANQPLIDCCTVNN